MPAEAHAGDSVIFTAASPEAQSAGIAINTSAGFLKVPALGSGLVAMSPNTRPKINNKTEIKDKQNRNTKHKTKDK
jgi:hypothetical protein